MKVELDWMFHATEVRLFTGGPAAYMVNLSRTVDRKMAEGGGIKPFSYECSPEGWGSFKLKVTECGRALRTDAQRALVRARAAYQRRPRVLPSSRRRGRSA